MYKKAIELELTKSNFDLELKIKIAPELEAYFKKVSDNQIEVSQKWTDQDHIGLKFYKKMETMSRKVDQIQVIDNFGNGLVVDDKINVALLRIVGAGTNPNGVTIKTTDLLGYEELKIYIERLALWTKSFYEYHLQPTEIKALIGFEVEPFTNQTNQNE